MDEPIRVYLDSSDFSKFSELQKQSSEYKDTFEYLIKKRDEGLITICFSEAHVIEAAPTSPAAIPAAIERFRTIKNLCLKNSLIHPIDVWASESRNKINFQEKLEIVRNDGTWLPSVVNLLEILPDVDKLVAEEIKTLTRENRRKYLKNGKPTLKAYANMQKFYNGNAHELAQNLPLTPNAVKVIEQYFLGKSTRTDALNALQVSLTDLEEFGNWYSRDWKAASDLSQHLRHAGEEFKRKLLEARTEFDLLLKERINAGDDISKLQNLFKRTFQEALASSNNKIASGIAEKIGVSSETTDNPWNTAPGTTCSLTLAMHVARRSILGPMPRVPSHSDFPDCYHAVYLPYVDIYRPDSFMVSVLKECNLPFPTTIVEKLLQIPAAIEKILAERAIIYCV